MVLTTQQMLGGCVRGRLEKQRDQSWRLARRLCRVLVRDTEDGLRPQRREG